MQNSRPTPFKQSAVYRMVNKCILLIFLTEFILVLVSTISFGLWTGEHSGPNAPWYLGTLLQNTNFGEVLVSFVTFFILYNNLVPISLYVSLDMIKVCSAALSTHASCAV